MQEPPMNSLMVDLAQVKANYDRERERETGTAPMNVSVPLDIIALKKEVKKSEFIHSSLMDTKGTIIQFLNSQAMHGLGVAEVFGGIRIAVDDPRKIPGYLSKYKGIIRNHARLQLEAYLKMANHVAGFGEKLADEDFGMTFRWASLSPTGSKLIPSARKEGPVFYGVIPSYVEPTNAAFDPSEPDEWVHVINCHINLMGQNARRTFHIKESTKPSKVANPLANKRPGAALPNRNQKKPRNYAQTAGDKALAAVEALATHIAPLAAAMKQTQPEKEFPKLPKTTGPNPKWEKNGPPILPDA